MVEGKPKPYKIGFYFVRDTHIAFDYNNASQVLCDLMQEPNIGWVDNDDTKNVVPVFLGSHKDAKNPGVYITVIEEGVWQSVLDSVMKVSVDL